jgi:hypothetical protein
MPNLLPERLREFVDGELADYHRCDVAGELQQLSDELVAESIATRQNGRRPGRPLKLTAEIARQIRASSETGKELAARFGVSQATISHIRRGHTWRDA